MGTTQIGTVGGFFGVVGEEPLITLVTLRKTEEAHQRRSQREGCCMRSSCPFRIARVRARLPNRTYGRRVYEGHVGSGGWWTEQKAMIALWGQATEGAVR
jgi:hypothetical protein